MTSLQGKKQRSKIMKRDAKNSFWTVCYSCSMLYEYPKQCKNKTVSCANCCKVFEAIECPAPSMFGDNNPWTYEKQQRRKRASQLAPPPSRRNVRQKRTNKEDAVRIQSALLGKAKNLLKASLERVVKREMPIPDADFFDKERSKDSFGENQLWAAYDESDGMPRFYAMVHRVVSREPFKIRISWLISDSNEDLGPMNWIGSGFHKTSGCFSIGKRRYNETLNSFSHRVKYWSSKGGFVQIYPQKGDVWALYANWSPSWDITTPQQVVNKYQMVQVLEDFDGERGVTVAPLVKVDGFQNVFRPHPNPMTFPTNELFRFSHQIASRLLTGQDSEKGCLELDPAAMSPELLITKG